MFAIRLTLLIALSISLLLGCAKPETSEGERAQVQTSEAPSFWDEPQAGANSFNAAPPDQAYFEALAATGASWVRLTFSKWDGEGRDFLIGNADEFTSIPPADMANLIRVLDNAHAANMKVVIAPLTLPGARFSQHNDDQYDDRLWSDKTYWAQTAEFWAELSMALKDHPAVIGYNMLNEPAPEKMVGGVENGTVAQSRKFAADTVGTARDLFQFYETIITAIRAADPDTPIMVDAGYYANPISLAGWASALSDDNILYSIHMYEPYNATSAPNRTREVPLRYPGVTSSYQGAETSWSKDTIKTHIGTAFDWARSVGVPANRMVIGEFGCVRDWVDCEAYLTDVLDVATEHQTHWAFYAFRPDEWDAMDYELPIDYPAGQFYWLREDGRVDELPRNGALMRIIQSYMPE